MIGTRAVGFCVNTTCRENLRAVRLEDCAARFECGSCGQIGRFARESTSETRRDDVYDAVRVEYGYDPVEGVYTAVEVAREPGMLAQYNVYTLCSPLIERPETARRLAQLILGKLNGALRRGTQTGLPRQSRAELIEEGWKTVA